MKKFLITNKNIFLYIFSLVFIWRVSLELISVAASFVIPQRTGYIGPIPWANFDGMHYLSIAQHGYFQYEQAFFPLFPLLIRCVSYLTFGNYLWAGMVLVYLFLFLWLYVFYLLLRLDFSSKQSKWVILFCLCFPTSFFFGAVYTETFFLFLITASFLAARKEKWFLAACFISLASATKLIGIFLLPAVLVMYYLKYKQKIFSFYHLFLLGCVSIISSLGLISYMVYLKIFYSDPLFFIHAQPAFGANRTGGTLIFLPQVVYRYIKIFLTVPFSNYDIWIALLELSMLVIALGIFCWVLYKRSIHVSYILFSILAVIGPTLTGSLSSIPRYILVAFPVFIFLGVLKSTKTKIIIVTIGMLLLLLLSSYYLRGYFIA